MITVLALLSSPSLAQSTIDCTGLDPFTCPAVNELSVAVNALHGSSVLTEAGPYSRRPSTLVTRLDGVRSVAETAGCSVEGWTGGDYLREAYRLTWADLGETPQPGAGSIEPDKSVPGTYDDGVETLLVGERSRYNKHLRVFSSRGDNGFAVGHLIRINGRKGLVASLHGTCPEGIDPALVFTDWFGAPWLDDLSVLVDRDGDGFGYPLDCDDGDPDTFPGAAEDVRDYRDSDCDREVDEDTDADDDDFFFYDECDDGNADIHPNQGHREGVVNGIDDDCDDLIDDDVDQDGDGFTPAQGDCDDHDAMRHPDGDETVLNGVDDDCDYYADEDVDEDGDGVTLGEHDCDDGDSSIHPGAAQPLDCDVDNDGYLVFVFAGPDDCDDTDASAHPGILEDGPTANGVDDNCNGVIDDDVDSDGDGFTPKEGDCDDGDSSLRPGAPEALGDGIDSDCIGGDNTRHSTYVGSAQYVPAGTFEQGCDDVRDAETGTYVCDVAAQPVHTVTLTRPLWVMRTEVTEQHRDAIRNDTALTLPIATAGGPNSFPHIDPVAMSWNAAVSLANLLNANEGLPECAGSSDPYTCTGWRLPTEAEWEYAARAGEDAPFSGSLTAGAVATYRSNSTAIQSGPPLLQVSHTCHRSANAWGLCDMSGNLGEWTSLGDSIYPSDPVVDPLGGNTDERVVRGGGFASSADGVMVSRRELVLPRVAVDDIGVRLVRSLATDVDHDLDGYTIDEGDCDPADPLRSPGEQEVPGNGIDDDCDTEIDE